MGGVVLGLLLLALPTMYGVGYPVIGTAIGGGYVVGVLLLLLVGKIVATSLTIGIGGSGGVFAPSLFIGGMLGEAVGQVLHALHPSWAPTPGAYALVGMGAVFAGAARTPITAVLIMFRTPSTRASCCAAASTCTPPVADEHGEFRGVVLATDVEKAIRDGDDTTAAQLSQRVPVLQPDSSLESALDELIRCRGALPVARSDGTIQAWVTHHDLLRAAAGITTTATPAPRPGQPPRPGRRDDTGSTPRTAPTPRRNTDTGRRRSYGGSRQRTDNNADR